jgi:hypothetical protein
VSAFRTHLPGNRLNLRNGPIDLVIGAVGKPEDVAVAYERACEVFEPLLMELVAELSELRTPVHELSVGSLAGPVARRMADACRPLAAHWVTSMASVAGAVADFVLERMLEAAPDLRKAFVNNGGDIALHLDGSTEFEIGLIPEIADPGMAGRVRIAARDPVRGVATSGRGGRSLSRGIADAVTVLARSAAEADVAATLIANQVDLPDHPAIERVPARDEDPDSELGDRLVVVGLGALLDEDVAKALAKGLIAAEEMRRDGLIHAASLSLNGVWRVTGFEDLLAHQITATSTAVPSPVGHREIAALASALDPR